MNHKDAVREIKQWRDVYATLEQMNDDKIAAHLYSIIVTVYDRILRILDEVEQ